MGPGVTRPFDWSYQPTDLPQEAQAVTPLSCHSDLCEEALSLMASKSHDYTDGQQDDPQGCYANFRLVEHLGIASTSRGILARMADKMSRLVTLTGDKPAQVADEKLRDTVIDLINYAVVLYAWEQSGEGQ